MLSFSVYTSGKSQFITLEVLFILKLICKEPSSELKIIYFKDSERLL